MVQNSIAFQPIWERCPLSFRPSHYAEILVMQKEERHIEPDVAQNLEVDCDGDLYKQTP